MIKHHTYSSAVFIHKLWTMSVELRPDFVESCPFIHVAYKRRLSMSDVFSLTGNTV